jgi:hypothetical protein
MPRTFRFPESMGHDIEKAIWLPRQPSPLMLNDRGYSFENIVGQLRKGITLSQAQSNWTAPPAISRRKAKRNVPRSDFA